MTAKPGWYACYSATWHSGGPPAYAVGELVEWRQTLVPEFEFGRGATANLRVTGGWQKRRVGPFETEEEAQRRLRLVRGLQGVTDVWAEEVPPPEPPAPEIPADFATAFWAGWKAHRECEDPDAYLEIRAMVWAELHPPAVPDDYDHPQRPETD